MPPSPTPVTPCPLIISLSGHIFSCDDVYSRVYSLVVCGPFWLNESSVEAESLSCFSVSITKNSLWRTRGAQYSTLLSEWVM